MHPVVGNQIVGNRNNDSLFGSLFQFKIVLLTEITTVKMRKNFLTGEVLHSETAIFKRICVLNSEAGYLFSDE